MCLFISWVCAHHQQKEFNGLMCFRAQLGTENIATNHTKNLANFFLFLFLLLWILRATKKKSKITQNCSMSKQTRTEGKQGKMNEQSSIEQHIDTTKKTNKKNEIKKKKTERKTIDQSGANIVAVHVLRQRMYAHVFYLYVHRSIFVVLCNSRDALLMLRCRSNRFMYEFLMPRLCHTQCTKLLNFLSCALFRCLRLFMSLNVHFHLNLDLNDTTERSRWLCSPFTCFYVIQACTMITIIKNGNGNAMNIHSQNEWKLVCLSIGQMTKRFRSQLLMLSNNNSKSYHFFLRDKKTIKSESTMKRK